MASESIAIRPSASSAIDSEPIRARGIIVKYTMMAKPIRALKLHYRMIKFLLISILLISPHVGESRIGKIVARGIRNPNNDWNQESKFKWKKLEPSTWNPESTAWNPDSKKVLDSLTWRDW